MDLTWINWGIVIGTATVLGSVFALIAILPKRKKSSPIEEVDVEIRPVTLNDHGIPSDAKFEDKKRTLELEVIQLSVHNRSNHTVTLSEIGFTTTPIAIKKKRKFKELVKEEGLPKGTMKSLWLDQKLWSYFDGSSIRLKKQSTKSFLFSAWPYFDLMIDPARSLGSVEVRGYAITAGREIVSPESKAYILKNNHSFFRFEKDISFKYYLLRYLVAYAKTPTSVRSIHEIADKVVDRLQQSPFDTSSKNPPKTLEECLFITVLENHLRDIGEKFNSQIDLDNLTNSVATNLCLGLAKKGEVHSDFVHPSYLEGKFAMRMLGFPNDANLIVLDG